jgi:hypothetical protein
VKDAASGGDLTTAEAELARLETTNAGMADLSKNLVAKGNHTTHLQAGIQTAV